MSNNSDQAASIIRSRTLKSAVLINNDNEIKQYLKETVEEVARAYGKNLTDFSIADVKRAVDSVYDLLKKVNLENVTLTQVKSAGSVLQTTSDVGNIITFAESVAGIVSGHFGWLVWHISKNIAAPRIKRATAVYLVGHLANAIYGGVVHEIEIKSLAIDPIFESLDHEMLLLVSRNMDVSDCEKKSDKELIDAISNEFRSEGKHQSWLNAWFPKDAESYIEVLVVVAKIKEIDIRGLETVEEIEAAICASVFKELWVKLTPQQQADLSNKFAQDGNGLSGEYIFSTAGLGAIGLAQLSGFGVFTAASTMLAVFSTGLGIPVSFGVYTGLSSAIAGVIGPAGAVVLLPAIFEYFRAKPEKTLVGAIVAIAVFRSKLIAEGINYRESVVKSMPVIKYKVLIVAIVVTLISLGISLFFNCYR